MSEFALRDRCAIVTGASAGIGFATARLLAAQGADVVLNARDPERLSIAVDRLASIGARATGVPGDAASTDVISAMMAAAAARGGVAVAVANAGGGVAPRPLDEADAAQLWRANVWATEALIEAVSPVMVARGWGRIVTVASVSARRRSPTSVPAYAAAKAAVLALTQSAAQDLAGAGVTVNAVAPGVTATARILERLNRMGADEIAGIRSQIPAGRWADPEEVAAAIGFLCSEQAGYITGHTLDINGGAWMN